MRNIRTRLQDSERGFTLIELLVVIIIIGILAAIAIPVFLNQREKAWDSAAKSDIKNTATALESNYTDSNAYVSTETVGGVFNEPALADEGVKPSTDVDVTVTVNGDGSAYCIEATHAQSDATYYLNNIDGDANAGTIVSTPACTIAAPTP